MTKAKKSLVDSLVLDLTGARLELAKERAMRRVEPVETDVAPPKISPGGIRNGWLAELDAKIADAARLELAKERAMRRVEPVETDVAPPKISPGGIRNGWLAELDAKIADLSGRRRAGLGEGPTTVANNPPPFDPSGRGPRVDVLFGIGARNPRLTTRVVSEPPPPLSFAPVKRRIILID